MYKTKLNKVIEDGNIVIPIYILKFYKKLNLTMEEFVFLMYLYNKQDKIDFNPERIANDLNIDIMEVMGYISILTDKGYLTLDVLKTENNILEEVLNLTPFYEKVSMFLMNTQEGEEEDKNLLKYVEEQLGRPLNSIEIKTIESWSMNQIDSSLIKEALKIALRDGVYSLKYIDKILFDWKSRGFQTIDDVKQSYNTTPNSETTEEIDLEDWNWLDDEEEYITN